MIVVVLWFGGMLVLNYDSISGSTFIYYLVILYSIINPLKEFSKAGYAIPKGLASMERIDKILKAEIAIKDPEKPVQINGFNHQIEFKNVFVLNTTSNGFYAILTSLFLKERLLLWWDRAVVARVLLWI